MTKISHSCQTSDGMEQSYGDKRATCLRAWVAMIQDWGMGYINDLYQPTIPSSFLLLSMHITHLFLASLASLRSNLFTPFNASTVDITMTKDILTVTSSEQFFQAVEVSLIVRDDISTTKSRNTNHNHIFPPSLTHSLTPPEPSLVLCNLERVPPLGRPTRSHRAARRQALAYFVQHATIPRRARYRCGA